MMKCGGRRTICYREQAVPDARWPTGHCWLKVGHTRVGVKVGSGVDKLGAMTLKKNSKKVG